MTAIAGFCDQGHVWIGGDSAGVGGWDLTVRADQKVFRNGEFLFGFTSSFRMGQLLRYAFTPPAQKEAQDVAAFMVTDFINAVRECLKAGGYARKTNEEESAGQFLVGYRGRLFFVEGDYQVGESADGYDACGCGAQAAKGALWATREYSWVDPTERLRVSLEAAEHHSAGVRGPFHMESI